MASNSRSIWVYDTIVKIRRQERKQMSRWFEKNNSLPSKQSKVIYSRASLEDAKKSGRLIEQAHPILIGPSTAESVMGTRPERFDYIRDGKLPFDSIFFEFMEPPSIEVPVSSDEFDLLGIQLNKIRYVSDIVIQKLGKGGDQTNTGALNEFYITAKKGAYDVYAYYQSPEGKLFSLNFIRLNDDLTCPTGGMRFHGRDNTTETAFFKEGGSTRWGFEADTVAPILYNVDEKRILSEGLLGRIFDHQESMHGISTNLVNFVNSRNVRVSPARIKGQQKKGVYRNPRTGDIHSNSNKPYHIVLIESVEVEEPEEIRSGHTLEFRVYVRGHDRKYRDDNGDVRKVIWVAPYVKGPITAPWRHNRYAVLAEGIKREKEMLERYKS